MCKPGERMFGRDVVFKEALLWTWRQQLKGGGELDRQIIIIIIITSISIDCCGLFSLYGSCSPHHNVPCTDVLWEVDEIFWRV
jgi:hypothetical protein